MVKKVKDDIIRLGKERINITQIKEEKKYYSLHDLEEQEELISDAIVKSVNLYKKASNVNFATSTSTLMGAVFVLASQNPIAKIIFLTAQIGSLIAQIKSSVIMTKSKKAATDLMKLNSEVKQDILQKRFEEYEKMAAEIFKDIESEA